MNKSTSPKKLRRITLSFCLKGLFRCTSTGGKRSPQLCKRSYNHTNLTETMCSTCLQKQQTISARIEIPLPPPPLAWMTKRKGESNKQVQTTTLTWSTTTTTRIAKALEVGAATQSSHSRQKPRVSFQFLFSSAYGLL